MIKQLRNGRFFYTPTLLVTFLLFTADFIILPKAILSLLWIIGCGGIIADAGLDNGHSLSLPPLAASLPVSVSLTLALPPLREREEGGGLKEGRD